MFLKFNHQCFDFLINYYGPGHGEGFIESKHLFDGYDASETWKTETIELNNELVLIIFIFSLVFCLLIIGLLSYFQITDSLL